MNIIKSFAVGAALLASTGLQAATTLFGAPANLVMDHDAGNPVNLGNVFTVGTNYKVTSLGFFTPTNLVGGGETVGLYDIGGNLLASTFVSVAANTPGTYAFQAITPVQLVAGQQYVLVNQVGQNAWAYGNVTPTAGATFNYDAYAYGSNLSFPNSTGGSGPAYLGPNAILAVPEPASWALMIGGFGLVGAATRRRRSLAAA